MNSEYASGAVIYRRENGLLLYLLIFSGRNRIWGFPKGHIEPGEAERTAALREIEEETGLRDVSLIEGFRHEDIYPAVSNRPPYEGSTIEKHSIYFLAGTGQASIRVDGEEIVEYRWLPFDDSLALLPFEGLKNILNKAHRFLTGDEAQR